MTGDTMSAAGHRHKADRSAVRDGEDVAWLSAWEAARWLWSALVARRDAVPVPERRWGLWANTAREGVAAGPGGDPP